MILLMLLASAAVPTAVDAEYAFAKQAQTDGQWTAFRAWSTDDALMFVPDPVKAHEFLKDRVDPPEAMKWAPAESYVSCDGGHAINTGPWANIAARSFGYFTTVWVRQPDQSWKWVYDGGDRLAAAEPLPAKPKIVTASCEGRESKEFIRVASAPTGQSSGRSKDGTLIWQWLISPAGDQFFNAYLWNGREFDPVIAQRVPGSGE